MVVGQTVGEIATGTRQSSMNTNMNEEMHDNLCVAGTIMVIAICATITGLTGCRIVEGTKREAIKAGLVQKSVPGQLHPVWGKPDPK